jgi:hypothetical protein
VNLSRKLISVLDKSREGADGIWANLHAVMQSPAYQKAIKNNSDLECLRDAAAAFHRNDLAAYLKAMDEIRASTESYHDEAVETVYSIASHYDY